MKILLTLRQPLFPPDTGGKVRSLNIFARLAKRATIHAVSFADPVADAAAISEMKGLFESYTPVFWQETRKYSARFYKELVASQFSSLPYFLAKCYQPRFRSATEVLTAREHFDLIFCDFLQTAFPLLEITRKPKVVFEHNVEFLLRKRKWRVEKHPLRKMVYGSEWRKTRPIEARVCRSFDHSGTLPFQAEWSSWGRWTGTRMKMESCGSWVTFIHASGRQFRMPVSLLLGETLLSVYVPSLPRHLPWKSPDGSLMFAPISHRRLLSWFPCK